MARLQAEHITKRFGTLVANDDLSLTAEEGEVVAVLGENGAGKSTLMNVISGLLRPDAGSVRVGDRTVALGSPDDALDAGIGMIHQHFMLIPRLSVLENIVLGREARRFGFMLDWAKMRAEVSELIEGFGLTVDVEAPLSRLSVGERQRVEIIKAFYRGAKVLILDEPTALLTPQETEQLFQSVRRFASEGMAVVIISHKLDEVMAVSDRVVVIRAGKKVGEIATKDASQAELAHMMVGREVVLRVDRPNTKVGEARLSVHKLTLAPADAQRIGPLSFDVRAGEIFALAGVEGNGQREVTEALVGLRRLAGGTISLDGERLDGRSVRERVASGVGYVPADRQGEGLVMDLRLWENFILRDYALAPYRRGLDMDRQRAQASAGEWVKRLDVRPPNIQLLARQLSGGNQQKLLLAREFSREPKLMVVSQPTRGLDVGAVEFIHNELLGLKKRGSAVVLISLELDEILSLADRIMVMFRGQSMGTVSRDEANRERLGLMMTGSREEVAAGE